MKRPCRMAVRLVVLAALVAAPGCNTKFCAKEPGRKTPTCHQSTALYNCSASGSVCTITPC